MQRDCFYHFFFFYHLKTGKIKDKTTRTTGKQVAQQGRVYLSPPHGTDRPAGLVSSPSQPPTHKTHRICLSVLTENKITPPRPLQSCLMAGGRWRRAVAAPHAACRAPSRSLTLLDRKRRVRCPRQSRPPGHVSEYQRQLSAPQYQGHTCGMFAL